MIRTYPLLIDGADSEGAGWIYTVRASRVIDDVREALNLKRGLETGRLPEPDTDDVVVGKAARSDEELERRAVEAAHRAFQTFRLTPLDTRIAIVREFNQALRSRTSELIDLLVAEGHPRRLAQWEVSGMVRGTDDAALRWYRDQMEQEYEHDGQRIQLVRKPDGVVAVHPPANAAGSNSTMGVMALMAGNTLVVKAPRTGPMSVMFVYRELLAPVLDRYGAPPGTLNIVCGPAQRILQAWLDSPLVSDLLYFGDSTTGLQLGRECLARGKKAVLELAGNDGMLIWHDADLDAAATALTECFFGSSQICMVPKYCIVHPAVADKLLDSLLDKVREIRPTHPEADGLLSPVLKGHVYLDYLAEAKSAGAQVLCGGRRVDLAGEPDAEGVFCEPAVVRIDGLERASSLMCVREETFFPLLPVVVPEPAPDGELLDRVVEFMNGNEYGLRNSLWTGDRRTAQYIVDRLDNGGQLKINSSHIGFVPYIATHGGTGRTGGPYGELNYAGLRTSHWQGIFWGDGRPPQPLADEVIEAEGLRTA
jgi:acyl-CoA reductase-like NAD-dependent aldehyde dehydrogenase